MVKELEHSDGIRVSTIDIDTVKYPNGVFEIELSWEDEVKDEQGYTRNTEEYLYINKWDYKKIKKRAKELGWEED